MPTERMGPPPGASPPMRMTASWSGSNDPTEYKCAARDPRPMASSPRILRRQATVRRRSFAKSPCRCSSSLRVLWGQGAAKHKRRYAASRQALLAFRSLDPFRALREPDRRRRDEERLSRSEQRTDNKSKTRLDRKSPIQVRIQFPPAESPCLAGFRPPTSRSRAVFRQPGGTPPINRLKSL